MIEQLTIATYFLGVAVMVFLLRRKGIPIAALFQPGTRALRYFSYFMIAMVTAWAIWELLGLLIGHGAVRPSVPLTLYMLSIFANGIHALATGQDDQAGKKAPAT